MATVDDYGNVHGADGTFQPQAANATGDELPGESGELEEAIRMGLLRESDVTFRYTTYGDYAEKMFGALPDYVSSTIQVIVEITVMDRWTISDRDYAGFEHDKFWEDGIWETGCSTNWPSTSDPRSRRRLLP